MGLMLSLQRLGKAEESKIQYYTEMASPTVYYTSGAEPQGHWYGTMSASQGLEGVAVKHEDLMNYAAGFNHHGHALVYNVGPEHQIGFDLVFSAPKSVSVLMGLSEPKVREQVQAAHYVAVTKTLDYIEENVIGIRVGPKSCREFKNTKKALFALFEHASSRSGDPLLHTHALLLNLSEESSGNIKCIDSQNLFKHKKALGAMYRAELSHQLIAILGLEVDEDKEFFRLKGVPKKLCGLFSKRSNDIAEALEKAGLSKSNAKLKNKAAVNTRDKKTHVSREVLYQRWQKEAAEYTTQKISICGNNRVSQKSLYDYRTDILADVIQNHSVFEYRDLLETSCVYAQWHGVGSEAALKFVERALKDKDVVTLNHPALGKCYTTQQQIDLERKFYREALDYAGLSTHELKSEKDEMIHASIDLNHEQQKAYEAICQNQQNLELVNGKPGAGKSYLMRAVADTYREQGYHLQGCALAGSAADELYKSSGIPSQTIDSLLIDLELGRKSLKENSLLVVDEAGMVGVNKLAELLDYAFEAGAKIILVGDFQQLTPISCGSVFKRLIDHINPHELNNIQRQKELVDRQNVEKIGNGQVGKVLHNLKQRGLLVFNSDQVACKFQMVTDWLDKAKSNLKESIMLASTRYDVFDLNLIARAKLQEAGKVSGIELKITNHEDESFYIAEGERIMFRQNSKVLGVKNGSLGTVVGLVQLRSNSIGLRVYTDDDRLVEFKLSEYNAIEYGYAMSVHKSQGKTIDHAFVWLNDTFINRELNYVQMSRSRQETKVYSASRQVEQEDYWNSVAVLANDKTANHEIWDVAGLDML
jgi:Ti-type conjugative transfer relaxase TraA